MSRFWVPLATVAMAVALAGCYGSTEPATKITFDSATLNARGAANHGQAESWFELWTTGSTGTHLQVGRQTWPAGVSGPFSYDTQSILVPNTGYSFRACGKDVGGDPACAQTRSFTTLDGDTASGTFLDADATHGVQFDAWSGPHGERVAGSALYKAFSSYHRADVDCLRVSGNRAIVGTNLGLFVVTDGDPDTYSAPKSGSTPNCADATFADFTVTPTSSASATVHNAP
jgi:hypothetical protein